MVDADFSRRLERECDELQMAVNGLCEHFGVRPANTTLLAVEVLRIQRERDEAREKVDRQRKEIVRLNGATNHAGGTPLGIALRERDEAIHALLKIDEIYIDGDDTYDDRIKMGKIAREVLDKIYLKK